MSGSSPAPDDPPGARHALVRGRVQGVGFRYHARAQARSLGLAGWVRNRSDGQVELRFEGPREDLDPFTDWLRRGPAGARVDGLELREVAPEGLDGFEIAG